MLGLRDKVTRPSTRKPTNSTKPFDENSQQIWVNYSNPSYQFAYHDVGLSISKLLSGLFGKREMRILMVGLDAAGKTTIRKPSTALM